MASNVILPHPRPAIARYRPFLFPDRSGTRRGLSSSVRDFADALHLDERAVW